jgi:hypothetical protein
MVELVRRTDWLVRDAGGSLTPADTARGRGRGFCMVTAQTGRVVTGLVTTV